MKIKIAEYKRILAAAMAVVMITFTACGAADTQTDAAKEETAAEEIENPLTGSQHPYYYNEEHLERYEAYARENPDLTEDEVIWHVEADIDKDVYEDMTEIPDVLLDMDYEQLLVSKHFVLPEDYEPADLVTLKDGYKATEATVKAFREMEKAANADGVELDICSAYRSYSHQTELYNSYVASNGRESADTFSARPGSSEHETGRAIDMMGPSGILEDYENTESCAWIHENAYKYGFILRYGKDIEDVTGYMYESWHITYIGKEAAEIMHDENIEAFEEYWVKYVKYQ